MCANFEFGTSNTFRKSCDQSNKRLGKLCKDKTWWIVSLHQQHRGILERERLLWTNRYRLKLINVKVQGNWGEFHHLWYKAEQTRPSRPCEVLHWGQGQLNWENEIMDSWKLNVLEHSLLMYLKKKKTQIKKEQNKQETLYNHSVFCMGGRIEVKWKEVWPGKMIFGNSKHLWSEKKKQTIQLFKCKHFKSQACQYGSVMHIYGIHINAEWYI